MNILLYEDKYITDVVALWNKSCEVEMPYKPFNEEGFRKKFVENPHFCREGTFVAIEDDHVIGFANGICKKNFLPGETNENTPGYLTFVLIGREYRGRGYGSALLKKVEGFFVERGKKQAQVIFFNPVNLEWYIPGTDKHDHNNAPGVDADGPGYEFLKKNGYVDRSIEISFYRDLTNYALSDKTLEKMEELKQKGISMGCYDEILHHGFDELFDDLGSEDWRKGIKDNLILEKPYPVIMASDNGKICGFTGPVKVQESGRGWFVGIGTLSSYRGLGIMTVLFDLLLENFKCAGAKFSTLFTGRDNPARKTYERAGYRAVKTWAVMRKEL